MPEPGPGRVPEGGGPFTVDRVILRRLNRWQAEELREDLADLHVESYDTSAGEEFEGREEFLGRLAEDVQRPGLTMLIAEATTLVGCAYGYPVTRDGSWWEGFDGDLPQNIEQLTASGHVFAVAGMVVHPHERHLGLADRLQDHLLAKCPASLAATLLDRSDRAAIDVFRAWGWQEIGRVHRSPGQAVLRALVRPLGETHTDRAVGTGERRGRQQRQAGQDVLPAPRSRPGAERGYAGAPAPSSRVWGR